LREKDIQGFKGAIGFGEDIQGFKRAIGFGSDQLPKGDRPEQKKRN